MKENEDLIINQKIYNKLENVRKSLNNTLKVVEKAKEERTPFYDRHFNCDKCNEELGKDDKFVIFEVWCDRRQYCNDLVGEKFKIYHVSCWNKTLLEVD